jgi:hypothetical protein
MLPNEQVIAVVPEHDPWLGVTDNSVNPLGRLKEAETPVAADAPLFLTEIV